MDEIKKNPPVTENYKGCEIVAQPWFIPDENGWLPRVEVRDNRGVGGYHQTVEDDEVRPTYEQALNISLAGGRHVVDQR